MAKKTIKAVNDVKITPEDVVNGAVKASDDILDLAKGKFMNVVVIGYTPNGGLDIASTSNRYEFIQHALTRASFELTIHERNSLAEAQAAAAKAQEAAG